jgi:DNA-binding XRE family transcriptional regulator
MPGIDYNIFRNNLKKARYLFEMSGKDLSEKAGLRQLKRVNDIEEGRGKPTLEEVFSICEVLKQPIDDMLKKESTIKIVY